MFGVYHVFPNFSNGRSEPQLTFRKTVTISLKQRPAEDIQRAFRRLSLLVHLTFLNKLPQNTLRLQLNVRMLGWEQNT